MNSLKKQILFLALLLILNGCGIFSSPPTVPLEKKSLNSLMQEGMESFKNTNF